MFYNINEIMARAICTSPITIAIRANLSALDHFLFFLATHSHLLAFALDDLIVLYLVYFVKYIKQI